MRLRLLFLRMQIPSAVQGNLSTLRLYVVSTGREKFLIAGDVGNTTLISKLETAVKEIEPAVCETNDFKETMANLSKAKSSYMDKSNIGIKSSLLSQSRPEHSVLKNLAERMR